MSDRSTTYETFTVEHTYDATLERVFGAWATAKAKARWFAGPKESWKQGLRELDFSEGGHERLVGEWANGAISDYRAVYHDIVLEERIVYSYSMHMDSRRISVSLATVEFYRAGDGARIVVTEQGVFLDGYDHPGERATGTRSLLEALERSLQREGAGA